MTTVAFDTIREALTVCDPAEKCSVVASLDGLLIKDAGAFEVEGGMLEPGRPKRPELVEPTRVPRRRLNSEQGRAALIHAVAHIEFNAINLALDAAWRFRGLPSDYYADWLSVAVDEARHFGWLNTRLRELGHAYGDLDAHDGLWEMACKTAHDPLPRMALVPRVLEARGLDVTPGMIRRVSGAGDHGTVAILERILLEEERHVKIGSDWFRYLCDQRGLDHQETFEQLLAEYMPNIRGPLNEPARLRSGFTQPEMNYLRSQL